MKLSIIVPLYNVEETLHRCVESLLNQKLNDYEILLIDDESPDKSGLIAEQIAFSHENVKVFHKANGGLSDARNYGLERAQGNYITFVDSDDEVAENTYSTLLAVAESHPNYDIIEYPVLMNPGRKNEYCFLPETKEYANSIDWLSDYGLEHCWAWNKIYKRGMFKTVRFPIGKLYEDVYTMAELLKKKPFIATTNQGLYLYHWNKNGITNKQLKNGLTPLLEAQIHLVKTLGINTKEKRWHRLYLNMFTSQLHSYRKTGRILLWSQPIEIKKYVRISDFIKAMSLNILGLEQSCKLFKLLSRQ